MDEEIIPLTELEQIIEDLRSQEDCIENIIHSNGCKFGKVSKIELSSNTLGKKLVKTMLFKCVCIYPNHQDCILIGIREEGFTYEIIDL